MCQTDGLRPTGNFLPNSNDSGFTLAPWRPQSGHLREAQAAKKLVAPKSLSLPAIESLSLIASKILLK